MWVVISGSTGLMLVLIANLAACVYLYSTYLFTDRADSDFFILSTNGFTVMLLTVPSGMSPMVERIHLLRAASILLASLMGSRSRVVAQLRYTFAWSASAITT
jgi:hypothetical protein